MKEQKTAIIGAIVAVISLMLTVTFPVLQSGKDFREGVSDLSTDVKIIAREVQDNGENYEKLFKDVSDIKNGLNSLEKRLIRLEIEIDRQGGVNAK